MKRLTEALHQRKSKERTESAPDAHGTEPQTVIKPVFGNGRESQHSDVLTAYFSVNMAFT